MAADGTENAVHGSDSAQSVRREIKFFFPHRQVISPSPGTKPAIPKSLEDALCQGLTALAKQKPSHDPSTAIIWLGNWLLKHNPNKPLVYGPDELSLDEVDDGTEFPAFLPVQEDVQVTEDVYTPKFGLRAVLVTTQLNSNNRVGHSPCYTNMFHRRLMGRAMNKLSLKCSAHLQ